MQIDIDFHVFKALTALRRSESDSYNAVVRRLLSRPMSKDEAIESIAYRLATDVPTEEQPPADPNIKGGLFGLAGTLPPSGLTSLYSGGIWLGNAHFPERTKFRANYKGQTYFAEVRDGQWIGQDGVQRSSPSEAASAITGNNVNGWRFWHVQIPEDPSWRKLEEFRS